MTATIQHDHLTYNCPDWCVETPERHEKPEVRSTGDGSHQDFVLFVGHVATRIGNWSCTAEQNVLTGELFPDVTLDIPTTNIYFEDPAVLRKVLEDGAKALAWMESVR